MATQAASFNESQVTYAASGFTPDAALLFGVVGGAQLKASFRTQNAGSTARQTHVATGLRLDVTPGFAETIVPGSLAFSLGAKLYYDRNGSLFTNLDPVTGVASPAGTINYTTGEVAITNWTPQAAQAGVLHSLLTSMDQALVDQVTFRVPVAPVRNGSLQVLATRADGGQINVVADLNGRVSSGDVTLLADYETGVVVARFGAFVVAAGNEAAPWFDPLAVRDDGKVWRPMPVFANTIRYNAVGFTFLPLDAGVLGLDPVRLPQDGRAVIYRTGGFVVLGHTKKMVAAVANGQTVDHARVRLSRVRVVGADGVAIHTGYTSDLEAGTTTFTDVAGYAQPVTIEDRVEDLVQVSDVQINGALSFTRQITHDYPVGAAVSSALIAGDLRARVEAVFDQQTWANVWANSVSGSNAPASYNDVANPIDVTNLGAITERWALVFTGNTAFNIVGEHVGVIGTGTTGVDTAPINPATGTPYFTVKAPGWNLGWVAGNALRFNTVGAQFPIWVVRTIQQGPETVESDSFTLLVRGDVDNPA